MRFVAVACAALAALAGCGGSTPEVVPAPEIAVDAPAAPAADRPGCGGQAYGGSI
jgi:hypothetical protein